MIKIGALIVLLVAFSAVSNGATTINVSDAVVTPAVKRIGLNLGRNDYYDSGEMSKLLVFRNPGFEGQLFQSAIRCQCGTATSCTDDDIYSIWYTGFWDGATYEVIWGAAKGRT